jgi:hypothetical protein
VYLCDSVVINIYLLAIFTYLWWRDQCIYSIILALSGWSDVKSQNTMIVAV